MSIPTLRRPTFLSNPFFRENSRNSFAGIAGDNFFRRDSNGGETDNAGGRFISPAP
jgi:hypothetical protein